MFKASVLVGCIAAAALSLSAAGALARGGGRFHGGGGFHGGGFPAGGMHVGGFHGYGGYGHDGRRFAHFAPYAYGGGSYGDDCYWRRGRLVCSYY